MRHSTAPLASCLAVNLLLLAPSQAARRLPVSLLSPKPNTSVGASAWLHGRISRPGQPVVLVKAKADKFWWVQPVSGVTKKGYFKSSVRFGNEKTPDGCRFQILVLLVQDSRILHMFKVGASIHQVPRLLPRSREIEVKFERAKAKKEKAKKTIAVVLRAPAKGQVKRVHTLDCQLKQPGRPVVLVRSGIPNSPWWVQQHPKVGANGQVKVIARFGNEKTKPGSKFKLVVVLIDHKVKIPAPGSVIKKLPDVAKSRVLSLVRE